jgi:hypothetical protein
MTSADIPPPGDGGEVFSLASYRFCPSEGTYFQVLPGSATIKISQYLMGRHNLAFTDQADVVQELLFPQLGKRTLGLDILLMASWLDILLGFHGLTFY